MSSFLDWTKTETPWVENAETGLRLLEADLNAKVVKYIKALPRAHAKKRKAGPGRRGEPDVTGCIEGRRLEVEGKIWPNKLTPKQRQCLERWSSAGALVFVYYSLEDFKAKLEAFCEAYNKK